IVRRCDLFEPGSQGWRRVADTFQYREYHALTLLVPDGRVITTGGTYIKFQYGPVSADIDAYSPPYLFRGVRPALSNLSDNSPSRGQWISFDVAPATRLTRVMLMGVQSTTHWVDAGIPRRLELRVAQIGQTAYAYVPTDPNAVPLGWYMLFGMVDDIPSPALFLRVDP
ncbi:MAG: galactose oxidase-like domain-containing protein, partial [Planctomycetota bacterium]